MNYKVDAISAIDIFNFSLQVFIPLMRIANDSYMQSIFIETSLFYELYILCIKAGSTFYACIVRMDIEHGVAGTK